MAAPGATQGRQLGVSGRARLGGRAEQAGQTGEQGGQGRAGPGDEAWSERRWGEGFSVCHVDTVCCDRPCWAGCQSSSSKPSAATRPMHCAESLNCSRLGRTAAPGSIPIPARLPSRIQIGPWRAGRECLTAGLSPFDCDCPGGLTLLHSARAIGACSEAYKRACRLPCALLSPNNMITYFHSEAIKSTLVV